MCIGYNGTSGGRPSPYDRAKIKGIICQKQTEKTITRWCNENIKKKRLTDNEGSALQICANTLGCVLDTMGLQEEDPVPMTRQSLSIWHKAKHTCWYESITDITGFGSRVFCLSCGLIKTYYLMETNVCKGCNVGICTEEEGEKGLCKIMMDSKHCAMEQL